MLLSDYKSWRFSLKLHVYLYTTLCRLSFRSPKVHLWKTRIHPQIFGHYIWNSIPGIYDESNCTQPNTWSFCKHRQNSQMAAQGRELKQLLWMAWVQDYFTLSLAVPAYLFFPYWNKEPRLPSLSAGNYTQPVIICFQLNNRTKVLADGSDPQFME